MYRWKYKIIIEDLNKMVSDIEKGEMKKFV